MRSFRRLRAALPMLAALTLVGLSAGPALAGDPVGGPLLGSAGTIVSADAPALPRGVVAGSWLVADLDSGSVLAAHDPHGQYAPASTLKTLTALTLIPRLDPAERVVPTWADLTVDGTRVGLAPKVAYPVRELFTSLLVTSANDAAMALADAGGGTASTVAAMNAEAQRLHALDTHADNPSGLDAPGQVTSAYDLALIARAAMALPDFRAYVATKHSSISAPGGKRLVISSHDKLLYNYPGAIGIKNGYTVHARASMIGAARRGGHTLMVVLLRTPPRVWPYAAALLDWGFAAEAAGVQPVGQLVDPDQPAASAEVVPRAAVRPLIVHAQAGAALPGVGTWTGRLAWLSCAGLLGMLAVRQRRRRSFRLR